MLPREGGMDFRLHQDRSKERRTENTGKTGREKEGGKTHTERHRHTVLTGPPLYRRLGSSAV